MKNYICNKCGYLYQPNIGEPEKNIPEGTEFKDLPKDWTCFFCDAGKKEFFPV